MYQPAQFRIESAETCHNLIRRFPLGALITFGSEGIEANHIPFVVHPELGAKGTLRAHLARANPQWSRLAGEVAALVAFQAADGYVTPSLYPSKAEHGKVVPTWNYVVVHARGLIRLVEDEAWLQAHLEALTAENEAEREHPWAVSDAPAAFVGQLKRAIVGIEIEIAELSGKAKVSQNRPERDRSAVLEALRASPEARDALMSSFLEGKA